MLRQQVGLSLAKRAEYFTRQFGKLVTVQMVRQIYRKFKIKPLRLVPRLGGLKPLPIVYQQRELDSLRS